MTASTSDLLAVGRNSTGVALLKADVPSLDAAVVIAIQTSPLLIGKQIGVTLHNTRIFPALVLIILS
jgi:hypothetical protein